MVYLLAIDQGTTATTVLLSNEHGAILSEDSQEYLQHFPHEGMVEHQGHEIKYSVKTAIKNTIDKARINPNQIAALGVTNQRETLCLFDNNNHSDIPFIVWQCRRSAALCHELKERGLADFIHKKSGLHLDPYFTATKLLWLFKNDPSIMTRLKSRELLFGTVDTFLCHWLSGGALHITDPTNASRTMLMDLETCNWNQDLLDIFSVPKSCLPTIKSSCEIFGKTRGLDFLPDGIPIGALIGDQQSSLVGHACFSAGQAKATFGTGCFIMLNTGKKIAFSKAGLLTSVAYKIGSDVSYCLEGAAFIAGAALSFMRDTFGLISTPKEIDLLANSVTDSQGITFLPALCGLGAPHWRPEAKGVLSGFTRGSTKGHIARAVLEGIALQNTDIFKAMAQDDIRPSVIKVDGGASVSDILLQIQADLLNINCIRTKCAQKTAMGALYLAGLACGIFTSTKAIESLQDVDREFAPSIDRSWVNRSMDNYQKALAFA